MRIKIQCWSKDSGVRHDNGESYHQALFLDVDPDDKLGAFLKYSGDDVAKLVVGKTYDMSLKTLSPAKGDKSSYYISGRIHESAVTKP